MVDATPSANAFAELGLPTPLLDTLIQLGYKQATSIQSGTIPPLLAGRDVVGIAQTGTGKTAAFALPIVADIDLSNRRPQALVLCPTRELSLQVADAFRSYARNAEGLRVLAICGGADMRQQLRSLRDGVHVVVATPGRMLDHIQRGSVDLSHVTTAVLDEADEMLRMGFIDDVDAILAKTPSQRRVALFSATMPPRIRQIAQRHLKNPVEVAVTAASSTNANIEQFYWLAKGASKVEALKRLLAYEETDGVIVFTRTRESTSAVAEHLSQAGYRATALHGDMDQKARVRTVGQLKVANSMSWWQPMWRHGVLMWTALPTLLILIFLSTKRPTCTGSVALDVLAVTVKPFCSSPPVNAECYVTSSDSPKTVSPPWNCPAWGPLR